MGLNPGDLVKLKNTSTSDTHYVVPGNLVVQSPDSAYDGLNAVIIEGPYNKPEYGEIQLYRIRTDDPKLGYDQFEAECTWSALEKVGEDRDMVEYFKKVKEWEKHLNE